MQAVQTPSKLEYVCCILCGKDKTKPLFQIKGFSFVRCTHDGLVYINPRIADDQLESIYDQHYYSNPAFYDADSLRHFGYDRYVQDKENIKRNFEPRVRRMTALAAGGGRRLLDVGCAMGYLLETAQEQGWQAEGIEICAFACETARRNGLNVRNTNLRQLDTPAGSYDAITMLDVIEHFGKPDKEVQRCNELLKTGGLLVVTTPDVGSPVARLTGRHWIEMKRVMEHIYFFSRDTLGRLLAQKGFEIVRVETTGRIFELQGALEMAQIQCAWLATPLLKAVRALGLGGFRINVNPGYKMTVYARKVRDC